MKSMFHIHEEQLAGRRNSCMGSPVLADLLVHARPPVENGRVLPVREVLKRVN